MKLRNIFLGTCAALALPLTSSAEDKIDFNEVVKKIKVKGDYRLRYERLEYSQPAFDTNRDRWRNRLRVNFGYELNDNIKFDIRIATGYLYNPTSTNETLGFSRGKINLDRAFFTYKQDNYSIMVGQQKDPFVRSNIFFDSDLNPAGITFAMTEGDFFVTLGTYAVIEVGSLNTDTAYLHAIQLGFADKDAGLTAAIAYYYYQDKNALVFPKAAPQNIDFYVEYKIDRFTLLGQYTINNNATTNNDTAYVVGISAKATDNLSLGYKYVKIEGNSVHPSYDDSDFGSELGNNKKGHILSAEYKTCSNSSISLKYIDAKAITTPETSDTLQLDFNLKF